MEENIQKYLIASLKQDEGCYTNVINAIHPFPCGIYQKNVSSNQKSIECTMCKHWIHIKCNGTTIEDYNKMIQKNSSLSDMEILNIEWICNKCQISELAKIFPFGLETNHEIHNINNLDSLKTLEMLPNYEIVSIASDIGALKQFDVDENIINNIISRYYPA